MHPKLSRASLTIVFAVSALLPAAPLHAAPGPGSLIKTACPANASANDPCKAVYYYGGDGRRHAFSNDKVYFSWYADFSGVQTISASALAAIKLGSNVTYRPGVKMVKFPTVNAVYVVALGGTLRWVQSEEAARGLYGDDWNKKVDDISEAFFTDYRMGADVTAAGQYDRNAELAAASSIDAGLESSHRSLSLATERGTFSVDVVTMQKDRYAMITDVAEPSDCATGCAAKSLATYATEDGATIGIHGTYFCPPDYADCAAKTYSFLWPVFDTATDHMLNAGSLPVHEGPIIAQASDGRYFFYHRTKDFGNSVAEFEAKTGANLTAALSNYPSLIENGTVVVESESRLDDGMKTVRGTRGAIGYDDRSVYLVVARSATVVDLAYVMKAIGAKYALNLDGGGSAALLYDNAYKIGPGRLLPNAILFKKR
jgi:hypothetical protein